MLHEIKAVKQERGPGRRRWFESDGLDLVLWLDRNDAVTGFQLCYDFGHGEHALTWRRKNGFAHSVVDAGEDSPLANRTPVLEPDPKMPVPWRQIALLFDERCQTLEPELQKLIREQLASQVSTAEAE